MANMAIRNLESDLENNTNSSSFIKDVVRFNLNYLTRFAISGVVVYACWIAIANYNYWFSWHVILCTFGYLPLMAESIMLFTGDEVWSRGMSRTAKYTIHGIIVTASTCMIIAGDALVFHYISAGYHLNSAHGITGFISMILLIVSVPIGLLIKYSREMNSYVAIPTIWYKTTHNILGILGYAVGIVSLCYAYYTNWFVFYTTHESRLLALTATILASCWTLNGAITSLWHQLKGLLH